MNEHDRAELELLQRRQEALQLQVAALTAELSRLAERLNAPPANAEIPPLEISSLQMAPDSPASASPVLPVQPSLPTPPPLPPLIPATAPEGSRMHSAASLRDRSSEPPHDSFEMKLGTYWLVRVGIVMLLTGLVFLGTYAYKNFIGKIGPAGKVTLLYVAGAALLGVGAWLQRQREKEGVRNYGQVLFAGGLAAVYFTTYGAHYVPALRVINSALVTALLLLAWSGFVVWLADRRRSEVLALFAIGLSYYTSAITNIGLFTLGSNLLLTVAAVFFLVRHRWTTLSFISLVATYGGFAFWRFHEGDWGWLANADKLWMASSFLGCYWLIFTSAVFFSRGAALANVSRAFFASLNNGAFFGLLLLSILPAHHDSFWKVALSFGAVLLGSAALARKLLWSEPILKRTYLVQGLALVTAGFIGYFTGLKLALVLAVETVVLTFLGQQQKNLLLRAGAGITAALSVMWTVATMGDLRVDLWLGSAVSAAMLLCAWWESRHDPERGTAALRPFSGGFSALAIFAAALVIWHATPQEWFPVVLMLGAVLFTGSIYVLRVPDLPVLAQSLAIAAQGFWFFSFAMRAQKPHWLVPATLVIGTLALSHWWQRQQRLTFNSDVRNVLQITYGLALVGVLFFWFKPEFAPAAWLAFLCALAVGVTVYGMATRAWALAACAQVFLFISSGELVCLAVANKPAWHFALVPIATWLALGIATTCWLERHKTREELRAPLLNVSTAYRAVAIMISLWWVFAYVPLANRFWTFCAVGLAVLAMAGAVQRRETLAIAAVFLVVGMASWLFDALSEARVVNWPNALAILAVLAAQRLARRLPQRFAISAQVHSVWIIVSGAALWLFVSRWVGITTGTQFLLTASWAVLAGVLFTAGFVLRERMHRWLGLGILASAVTRVFLFDVWRLETLYRILSFVALGIVLLALGFVYNKFQDKIRQWL